VTANDRVQQIALVSQRNAENRHKNTMFIKPRNFWAFGVGTAVAGCTSSDYILQSPCPRQKPNRSPIAACVSNFLRPELSFDHRAWRLNGIPGEALSDLAVWPKRVCAAQQGMVFRVFRLKQGTQFHYLAS